MLESTVHMVKIYANEPLENLIDIIPNAIIFLKCEDGHITNLMYDKLPEVTQQEYCNFVLNDTVCNKIATPVILLSELRNEMAEDLKRRKS